MQYPDLILLVQTIWNNETVTKKQLDEEQIYKNNEAESLPAQIHLDPIKHQTNL